ncbi:unnamed protein product, partial [Effrenium voratum]
PWHTHFLPEHSNPGASDFRNNRSCHGAPMVSARNISRGSASRPNLAASVVCPDGTQKDVLFDHRESFSEQVRKICQQLGVATNEEDEESFILTVASAGPVISSKADLANYLQHPSERLHLRRAAEVAESQLAAVKAGPRETALQQLLQAVKNESLRAEVVERDGIQLAVQDLLQNKDQAKLPLALLCELMNDESADTWLEDHEEDPDLGPPLFRQLLAMLFPEQDDSPDDNRHACLSILLSLLQKLPGAAGKCHKAIKEERDKEDDGLYSFLVACLDSDEPPDDCDEFQDAAANLLLANLRHSALQDGQEWIVSFLESAGVSAAAQERLKEESDSLRSSFDRLLAAYTSAAASLGTSKGTGLARPELEIMERRVENLQELNSKMKAQVRLQHEAMRKMVRFVSVHDDVIDKSLEGIVRFGWDGLRWKRGYTMLHYCAECVEEPAVVELVGLLATDVDRKDDNGMRPIDYARQSGREDIIKMLEHV